MNIKFIVVTIIESSYSIQKEHTFIDWFKLNENLSNEYPDNIPYNDAYNMAYIKAKLYMTKLNNESDSYFDYKFINDEYKIKCFHILNPPNDLTLYETNPLYHTDLPFDD